MEHHSKGFLRKQIRDTTTVYRQTVAQCSLLLILKKTRAEALFVVSCVAQEQTSDVMPGALQTQQTSVLIGFKRL
jgi:hypothetical protein